MRLHAVWAIVPGRQCWVWGATMVEVVVVELLARSARACPPARSLAPGFADNVACRHSEIDTGSSEHGNSKRAESSGSSHGRTRHNTRNERKGEHTLRPPLSVQRSLLIRAEPCASHSSLLHRSIAPLSYRPHASSASWSGVADGGRVAQSGRPRRRRRRRCRVGISLRWRRVRWRTCRVGACPALRWRGVHAAGGDQGRFCPPGVGAPQLPPPQTQRNASVAVCGGEMGAWPALALSPVAGPEAVGLRHARGRRPPGGRRGRVRRRRGV